MSFIARALRRGKRTDRKAADQPYARRMVRGVVTGTLTVGLTRFTGLLTIPLLLHLLGLPLYGLWAVATVFIGSQGLFDMGIGTATVRYIAEAEARNDGAAARRVILLTLLFYTLLSATVAVVILPILPQIPSALGLPVQLETAGRGLLLGAVGLFAISNYTVVCSSILSGLQRIEANNLASLAGQAVYLCLLILATAGSWGIAGVLVAVAGLYVTQTALMVGAILRHIPRDVGTLPRVKLRSLISYGWKIEVVVLADFVALQAPKLVAGLLLGAAAAGRLDIAMRLPLAASSAVLPLLPPLFPAASRLSLLSDAETLRKLSVRATRYLAALTLPIFVAVFVFGPIILHKWLGPNGTHLELSVRLLTAALLVHTLPGVATTVAQAGFVGLVVRYKLLLMLVTALLLPLAASLAGIDGISGAILIGFLASFVYLQAKIGQVVGTAAQRQMGLVVLQATGSVLAAAILGLVSYWLFATTSFFLATWIAIAVAVTVYAALIVRSGVVNRNDLVDLLGQPLTSRIRGIMRSARS